MSREFLDTLLFRHSKDSKNRRADAVPPETNMQLNESHSVRKTGAILVGPTSCSIRKFVT